MNSILPFQNRIRDVIMERKHNPRKSRHSTQFPNQIRNVDKNEKEKKNSRYKQEKMFLNQQSI
jgi:hypothetical protein